MERASEDDGDVGDPSVAILYFLTLRGSAEKRSSHLRKSLFRISHERHAIIPTRPSVMEPIDLPFGRASGILMSKVRILVGHKCLVQCTGQELGAITNHDDLGLPSFLSLQLGEAWFDQLFSPFF